MATNSFQREYKGYIWTNHSIERLRSRGIYQDDAALVMKHPDKTYPGKKKGTVKFVRTINNRRVHIVGSLNDRKQWVVLTAWVRGEQDQYKFPEKYVYKFVDWLMSQIIKLFRH